LHKLHFIVGSDKSLMTYTIGLERTVELAEIILAMFDIGFAFSDQKIKQPGCNQNEDDAINFEQFKCCLIDEQALENISATKKKPCPADTGVEDGNTEGGEVHVEFIHGVICQQRNFIE
jgi:hypothetical protein